MISQTAEYALRAIVFHFHVTLDQLAGRQNGLDALCTCARSKNTGDPQDDEP